MTKATQHLANPDQRDDKLDEEEQEILTAYESGKTTRVEDTVSLSARHREYAEATFRQDARINLTNCQPKVEMSPFDQD